MPPRKKGAAAASKKKGPAAQANNDNADSTASAVAAPSARRSTRGRKAAGVKEEEEVKAEEQDQEQEQEQEQVSMHAETSAAVAAAAPESEAAPASDPKDEAPPKTVTAELEGRVTVEEPTSASAPTGVPDIAGVVDEREDEDLAVDDTEPAPDDAEERRRLQEVPPEARATSQSSIAFDSAMAEQQVQIALTGQSSTGSSSAASTPLTKEERMAKMNALRKRMTESAQANRKDVISAQNEHRKNVAESKRMERKRKQAEAIGEKIEAMETGEDLERKRNWEYSLEDNEKWSAKLEKKAQRKDNGFVDYDDSSRRKYERDTEAFKPDLQSYLSQRELEQGHSLAIEGSSSGGGELVASGSGSLVPGSSQLYRDANSFIYADHKPSEDAIDRVIGQINSDIDRRNKRSRIRVNEEEGDVTYINDRNKVFNKKLDRFFNKYTGEIKANFERGTAL